MTLPRDLCVADPKDLAPGLRVSDLDRLLREHYAQGHRDGEQKAWDEANQRIAQQAQQAALAVEAAAEARLLQWMWPNVMNRVLTASEAAAAILDSPKSTIANDRKTVDRILTVLKQSLHTFHQKRPG